MQKSMIILREFPKIKFKSAFVWVSIHNGPCFIVDLLVILLTDSIPCDSPLHTSDAGRQLRGLHPWDILQHQHLPSAFGKQTPCGGLWFEGENGGGPGKTEQTYI